MKLLPNIIASVLSGTPDYSRERSEILFPTPDGDRRVIFPRTGGDDYIIQFPTKQ